MNKLVFSNLEFGKKEFYGNKKAMKLSSVDVDKIVVSNKIKGNNETVKFLLVIWMILMVLLDLYVLFNHK